MILCGTSCPVALSVTSQIVLKRLTGTTLVPLDSPSNMTVNVRSRGPVVEPDAEMLDAAYA